MMLMLGDGDFVAVEKKVVVPFAHFAKPKTACGSTSFICRKLFSEEDVP